MYWPIGAPKAYALSKHAIAKRTTDSKDGLEDDGASAATSASGESSAAASSLDGAEESRHNCGYAADSASSEILAAKVSRNGAVFATITSTSLTIWQAKPTVALAAMTRSEQSMKSYGPNCALLLRPDALVVVVQTTLGYLITYSLATDPQATVYKTQLPDSHRHARHGSTADGGYTSTYRRASTAATSDSVGPGEGAGIREVHLRFRMVIRIDAGISRALALDDELVVATRKPAALQCIRWVAEEGTPQTSTELVGRMPWYAGEGAMVTEMVHDRPMNLMCWISGDGRAYAVQRRGRSKGESATSRSLFQGFCFRTPEPGKEGDTAVKVAINARFSLIAVGLADGRVEVYTVKDYAGNVPFSHRHQNQSSLMTTGQISQLVYSTDGYCLFVGYEKGWSMYSVYGKPLGSSYGSDHTLSLSNNETWLL